MRLKSSFIFESFLLLLIVACPLWGGLVLHTPLSVVQIISFLLFLFLLSKVTLSTPAKALYPSGLPFILLFLGVVLLQLIPLSQGILQIVSPRIFSLHQECFPQALKLGSSHLSIYTHATQKELVMFLSSFFVFLIVINRIEKRQEFERLFLTLIIWGVLLSLYGVVKKYFILEKEVVTPFSTFGNKNHFAGYMTMITPLALGYALACKDRTKKVLFGFIAAFMCASIFLSLSRGGSIGLIFSLGVMVFLLARERVIKGKFWIVGVSLLVAVVLILIAGPEPIKKRFLLFWHGLAGRLALAADARKIVRDFPLFGVGWGAFRYIFPSYQTITTYPFFYYYLHNDHLQLIVETGFIGGFFYFAFLFVLLKEIFTKLFERKDSFVRSMVLGGMCGLLGIMVQGFFDFSFHIPGISLSFWLILGLIYKCVHIHFYSNTEHEGYEARDRLL
ncbi:MAG: O-antigen ligase family protein [Candidatus Omnitrophota bacterium]|nr:MAG: O-antigen ligase family protein [Candidatus Omnitrophota bacterium]